MLNTLSTTDFPIKVKYTIISPFLPTRCVTSGGDPYSAMETQLGGLALVKLLLKYLTHLEKQQPFT